MFRQCQVKPHQLLSICHILFLLVQMIVLFNIYTAFQILGEYAAGHSTQLSEIHKFCSLLSLNDLKVQNLERRVVSDVIPPDYRELIGAVMARTGTDKLSRHAYDRYYDQYFKAFRDKKDLMLLEIGAHNGKSIQLWLEYFSDPAGIHGVSYGEITEQINYKQVLCEWNLKLCDKASVFHGDQSDPVFFGNNH